MHARASGDIWQMLFQAHPEVAAHRLRQAVCFRPLTLRSSENNRCRTFGVQETRA